MRRRIEAFARARDGAAALEFAIIAIPFLVLLFGIFELAFIFIIGISVANATAYEARQIRVGNLITSTSSSGAQLDLQDLKTKICNQILLVPTTTCLTQIQIDVRTVTSFQISPPHSLVSGTTFNGGSLCYYSGGAGDIVEMRVYYLWQLMTPILLSPLANITQVNGVSNVGSGPWAMVYDTEIMKTEPVPGEVNTGTPCS